MHILDFYFMSRFNGILVRCKFVSFLNARIQDQKMLRLDLFRNVTLAPSAGELLKSSLYINFLLPSQNEIGKTLAIIYT